MGMLELPFQVKQRAIKFGGPKDTALTKTVRNTMARRAQSLLRSSGDALLCRLPLMAANVSQNEQSNSNTNYRAPKQQGPRACTKPPKQGWHPYHKNDTVAG